MVNEEDGDDVVAAAWQRTVGVAAATRECW